MHLKDKNLYIVGGFVRDQILGIPSFDIDYCYEGDAIDFAKTLKLDILQENPDFGTVRVLYEGMEIDIASTREETYPKKGHLPVVKEIGCPLEQDLLRRDFTINSIAKRTTDNELIDPLNGHLDIENKLIKVLHKDSFIDDPSRILRALKFAVRFGFKLSPETLSQQKEYLDNINYDMSFHRIKKELVETFSLNKQRALQLFIEQGIYRLLGEDQPCYHYNDFNIEKLVEDYTGENIWLVYMGLFNLNNLQLTRRERKIIEWSEKLLTECKTNNTPLESVLINKIRAFY